MVFHIAGIINPADKPSRSPILEGTLSGNDLANVARNSGADQGQRQDLATANWVSALAETKIPVHGPYVDCQSMEDAHWVSFVRKRQLERNVDPRLAAAVQLVYKQREGHARGQHLVGPWAMLHAYLREHGARDKVAITDTLLCNVAAVNASPESQGPKEVR